MADARSRPGEPVLTLDDMRATVVWIRAVAGTAEMDNLTVAKDHTYAVGASRAVAHNEGCKDT